MKSCFFALVFVGIICFSKGQLQQCDDDWSCDFGSECVMTSSNVKRCVCREIPCDDSEKDMALCGADGATYANVCEVRKSMCQRQTWIEIQHIGACGVETCRTRWDCLFEGKCINGECTCIPCRDIRDRRVFYVGEYANTEGAIHALKHTSVCGSDGITYESECHLRYHSCMAKSVVTIARQGVCLDEILDASRQPAGLLAQSLANNNIVQRSAVQKPVEDCSQVYFSQCVSEHHPRLRYMGIYERTAHEPYMGSPVYRLRLDGSAGSALSESLERSTDDLPVYLSRLVSRRHPKGIWIVGSELGSGRGWLGSADSAHFPQDIRKTWKSTSREANKTWVKEPTLSLHCSSNIVTDDDCHQSYVFDGPRESNWQAVKPRTPFYVVKVTQLFRNRRKKIIRKIKVQIVAKRKTKRFAAYILKLSNTRQSCGLPRIIGSKSQESHVEKCEGSIIMNKINKKMMKATMRFVAPKYGCIDLSAVILSVHGGIYEDDILTKRVCSDHF